MDGKIEINNYDDVESGYNEFKNYCKNYGEQVYESGEKKLFIHNNNNNSKYTDIRFDYIPKNSGLADFSVVRSYIKSLNSDKYETASASNITSLEEFLKVCDMFGFGSELRTTEEVEKMKKNSNNETLKTI